MNKNQRMNRMGVLLMIWAAACLNSHAQQDSAKVLSNSKEEGNRNVMLNAASANGPREISRGPLALAAFSMTFRLPSSLELERTLAESCCAWLFKQAAAHIIRSTPILFIR